MRMTSSRISDSSDERSVSVVAAEEGSVKERAMMGAIVSSRKQSVTDVGGTVPSEDYAREAKLRCVNQYLH